MKKALFCITVLILLLLFNTCVGQNGNHLFIQSNNVVIGFFIISPTMEMLKQPCYGTSPFLVFHDNAMLNHP
jgi:hypothetical protein